ncbi:hypothetical protein A2841_00955 [Candidatus Kaiserbacteria bacterium RIFCSPHIGHO2_01_FULL_48_10]|uniref:Phytanoyl-CoA dioxygenase n=1 Tax=Candidatus Kaiserbacteria bacterium RIFCSPHIGHO2_01_FULL_48_10 TaxID=1798476 RepID=A0A1F6C5L0_9BACT|nr:MAG: hypothetical protein A2841_00955 [Candidatus Kaiserbacteria bacterium RIFCSPHIGHO2_01_FULL_48_10]
MKKIKALLWGRIYLWIFRPLYKLENLYPLWRLVNRAAVLHFRRFGKKELSLVEKRIISELRETGVAITSLDELFAGAPTLSELVSFAGFETKAGRVNPVKPFIREFLEEKPAVTFKNPFARLALDERALSIIGTYLGMSPRFYEFTLTEIRAVPTRTEREGSMKWHRDPHDLRLCKMFLYLSDVAPENGPFTYLKYSNYKNKYHHLFPQVPPSGIYPPAEEVEKRIDSNDVFQCVGKAGTVVFADTSGLHWGGYVKEKHRRMLTAGFIPPKSFLVRQLVYKETGEELSPLQRFTALAPENLTSRNVYIALKKMLMGEKSVGSHITGMKMGV